MAKNRWLQHLANFRRQNSSLSARQMMTAARKTYQGGGVADYAESVSGSSVNAHVHSGVNNTESLYAAVGGRSRRGGCGQNMISAANYTSTGGRSRRFRGGNNINSSPAEVVAIAPTVEGHGPTAPTVATAYGGRRRSRRSRRSSSSQRRRSGSSQRRRSRRR